MAQITHNYGEFLVGQQSGIAAATQLPDVPAKVVYLTASTADVAIGPDNTVTEATGFVVTQVTHSPPLFVGNLNEIWVISASGSVSWLVQR